jgi:hypothetical protein
LAEVMCGINAESCPAEPPDDASPTSPFRSARLVPKGIFVIPVMVLKAQPYTWWRFIEKSERRNRCYEERCRPEFYA